MSLRLERLEIGCSYEKFRDHGNKANLSEMSAARGNNLNPHLRYVIRTLHVGKSKGCRKIADQPQIYSNTISRA